MFKPIIIYCNLLLIFSCLIYEAYGSHPYNDSLSSSTTVNDAGENTASLESAAQSTSPCNRTKPGKGKLRMRVPSGMGSPVSMPEKIKPNYPYSEPIDVSEDKANEIRNGFLQKSSAHSPSPRYRRKSFSSNNGLGYDRYRGSVQDNTFPRRMNRRMHSPPPSRLRNNLRKSMRNTKQQNGNNNFNISELMSGKLMPFRLSSFNRFGDSFNEDGDTQETEHPKNMRLGSMGYSTIFPSFGSSNGRTGMGMQSMHVPPGMGSPVFTPEKIKPNYPYSEPFGVSEDEANEIRNGVLQKSNFYRNKFDLKQFTLDDQLNNCAQDWANNMAKQQLFDHRTDNVYGENLYGYQNLKNLGEIAVDSWYNEMSIFTIGNEENVDTFHMTQLLWKKSTKLGVGVSQNPENGMYYVVANYDPKGNLLEHFKENLPEITVEDIEEAKVADKKLKAKLAKPIVTSWSSGSSIPLGSGWSNYGSYFN